ARAAAGTATPRCWRGSAPSPAPDVASTGRSGQLHAGGRGQSRGAELRIWNLEFGIWNSCAIVPRIPHSEFLILNSVYLPGDGTVTGAGGVGKTNSSAVMSPSSVIVRRC